MPGTVTGAVHVLVYPSLITILGSLSFPCYNEKTKARKVWVTSPSKWKGWDSKLGIWFPEPGLWATGPRSPPLVIPLDFLIALVHAHPPATSLAHPIVLSSILIPLFQDLCSFRAGQLSNTLRGTLLTNFTHSDHSWLHATCGEHVAYLLPWTPTPL